MCPINVTPSLAIALGKNISLPRIAAGIFQKRSEHGENLIIECSYKGRYIDNLERFVKYLLGHLGPGMYLLAFTLPMKGVLVVVHVTHLIEGGVAVPMHKTEYALE